MRRILHLLSVACLLCVFSLSAYAQESFTMPKKDGRLGDKTVTGSLKFYDMGGPDGNNAQYFAGYVRFLPSDASAQIQITFNSMDLTDNATVYIYDGDINFTGYYSDVPEGYLAKLSSDNLGVGTSYSSSSGSLSVLYHCKGSGGGAGWEADVIELPSRPQTWQGISASRSDLGTAYPGKEGQGLLGVTISTDGGLNPFSLSSVSVSVGGTLPLDKLTNVKLMCGNEQYGDTFETAQAAMTFAGDMTLKHGANNFRLIADIAESASAGQTIQASLTGAVVSGEQKVPTAISPEGTVSIANMVLFPDAPKTYEVGSLPIDFYDDGGINGKISEKFSGQVTFMPTTPGKKVRIRFTKLDLFNTSSTGLNDVLKVYNGTEPSDENLLATVLNDLITIHSTAADGSLTITLVSTTGVPKDGFEAVVEEFTPTAMAIDTATASHAQTGSVCAGAEDVESLLIDLKTINTEPVLSAEEFTFSNTSTAPVAKATLYYLGADASAAGTEVATLDNPGSTFTLKLTAPQALSERDNFFRLTYTIGEAAENGQAIDAALTSVKAGGKLTEVTDGNPEGNRVIENVYYSRTGTTRYKVNGAWDFKNTPSQYSYYAYDLTEGDQITTFVPAHAGQVIEIDFSKFYVNSSQSAYQTPATFRIYDGADTTAPVLWEMTYDTRDKGPQTFLRATNADGALTVLFNSGTMRGGDTSMGFKAVVSEYQSKPMQLKSVEVSQASTDIVPPGTKDAQTVGIKLTTEGDTNALTLSAIDVDVKGAQDIIERINIYSTANDSTFNTGYIVGRFTPDATKSVQTITFATPITLPEKASYLWIAYDMASSFAADRVIDAAIPSMTIGGTKVTPDPSDPEGHRLTKNIYYFQDGDNLVNVDGGIEFYDDKGPDGKYSNKTSGTVTFVPGEGKLIKLIFNELYTNYSDHLYIYNGRETTADCLLADFSGEKKDQPAIISTAADGSVTFKFEPIRNELNPGWWISVQAVDIEPYHVTDVTVTPVNDIKLLRGSVCNDVVKVAVTVEGNQGKTAITSIDFDALETKWEAVAGAKVWYTGEDATFNTTAQYGNTLTQAPLKFEGTQEIAFPGTYYFWLSYDIATEAELGSKVQASFSSLTYDEKQATTAEQTPALVTVQEGMHGTFTISPSGDADFVSIKAAVDAMQGGIDGPVEFLLADGNYKELVELPSVPGSSAINTVTMRSASGKRENVVINYDRYSDPGSSNYDKRYGVVTLTGIDHFTLRDVTVSTEATNFPGVIFVRDASCDNTITNCVVRSPQSTSASNGTNQIYMYSKNEPNYNSDRLTVSDNLIDGGYIGMYLQGASYVALPRQVGGRVTGNTFMNQGSKGIYVNLEKDFSIEGNTILSSGETTSSYMGMDINEPRGNFEIRNNVVTLTEPKSSAAGIYLRSYNPDQIGAGKHNIYNNEINISNVASAVTGVRFNTELPDFNFAHNTIRLRGEAVGSTGIYFSGPIGDGIVANNIVQNEAKGTVFSFNRQEYLDSIALRDNIVYTNGDNFAYVSGNKTFDEWTASAPKATGTVVEETIFLSDNILEPAEQGHLLDCKPTGFVETDMYGASRDAEHPTAGAYEYSESTGAPVLAEGYPIVRDIAHDSATIDLKSTLTGNAFCLVRAASEAAPTADELTSDGSTIELRKEKAESLPVNGLTPKTEYKAYLLLRSLRGIDSEVLVSEPFTTSYFPTTAATFENATLDDNDNILDGTFSFTGFVLEDITDGVGTEPNVKAAVMDDYYAVVHLTNADDLPLEGFFIKNDEAVTLKALDASLREVATKDVTAHESWTYIDLRDLGPMTYLSFDTEGDVAIDNFGGDPLPLSAAITYAAEAPVAEGSQFAVPVEVQGGVQPYSYLWQNAKRETVGTEAPLTLTADHSARFYVTVTDARGNVLADNVTVYVTGQPVIATFEDLYLDEESNWHGDIDDPDYMLGSFLSGSYEFNNYYMADWAFWSFFGYANSTSTKYENYINDQYNSCVGSGYDGSENYAVAYMSDMMGYTQIDVTNAPQGQTIDGVWLTNSAWVVDAILHGDGMSDAFGKGDKLTLTVTGIKADGTQNSIDFTLADYTADDERDRWYLDSWQWFDLKPLGDVTRLRLKMDGTKKNTYGLTTPTYVCLDNLGDSRVVTDGEGVILLVNEETPAASFCLQPYFSFDPEATTIAYSIESDDERITLEGDSVTVEAPVGTELSLIAHASQRGRHEYVSIPVTMDRLEGVGDIRLANTGIYPNPADDYVTVSTDAERYAVMIVSIDGKTVLTQNNCSRRTTLDVSALSVGHYIVVITDSDGHTARHRLIKR